MADATAEIERVPLCELSYCPAPNDPDWHVCLVTGSTIIEHHHVEGRGKKRTQDSTRVVPLSVPIHKRISLNELGDGILMMADGSKLYRIWDLHNETVHESKPWWMQPQRKQALDSVEEPELPASHTPAGESGPGNAAEEAGKQAGEVEPRVHTPSRVEPARNRGSSSAASPEGGEDEPDIPETKGEAASLHDGEAAQVGRPSRGDRRGSRTDNDSGGPPVSKVQPSSDSLRVATLALPGVITETSWEPSKGFDAGDIEAAVHAIKSMEWNRQWFAGDFANYLERTMGEAAWQYLSDLGYQPESLSNIMRVCEKIPAPLRRGSLRYSHHVVAYTDNREDIEGWLDKAEENQWSVAELRRQKHGVKKKTKRWSLEELRELLSAWERESPRNQEMAMVSADSIVFFLDYLAEQEAT